MENSLEAKSIARPSGTPIWAPLLLIIFMLSAVTLTRFPAPYTDEGIYASFSYAHAKTGHFISEGFNKVGTFAQGDTLCSAVITGIYAFLGQLMGFTLASARLIPFLMSWLAALCWFFIGRRLGISGLLCSLLFISTERIFYASHVFRPEASLVFANTLFIWILIATADRPFSKNQAFGRGLYNAVFVLCHGNGLVSAVLNSLEGLTKKSWNYFFYIAGGVGAILIFFLVQIWPEGGWTVFRGQYASQAVYHGKSFFDLIVLDLTQRWGRELIVVGTSPVAKILRIIFYLVMFGVSLCSLFQSRGITRKFAGLSLGTVIGYIFLVYDKIDIHIAEMIPFFLAAFISYLGVTLKGKEPTRLKPVLVSIILVINLSLTLHHGIKALREPRVAVGPAAILNFLNTEKIRSASDYKYLVGKMDAWFLLHSRLRVIIDTFADQYFPLSGGVIATGDAAEFTFFKTCDLDYRDPNSNFSAYFCKRN